MGQPTYGTFFEIFMTILYTTTLKPYPTYETFLEKLLPKKCPISWNRTVYEIICMNIYISSNNFVWKIIHRNIIF